ncbi:hypothetical protein L7F22_032966 [Adiantum nelumboides]|nr:hypothetical protein [Adiantum nelumboides]
MDKAQDSGWLRRRHPGRALRGRGVFTRYAAERGFLALATMSSTSPSVVPFGGRGPRIGNSPMSFAAPGRSAPELVADMAQSMSSRGRIKLFHRENDRSRRDGRSTPHGVRPPIRPLHSRRCPAQWGAQGHGPVAHRGDARLRAHRCAPDPGHPARRVHQRRDPRPDGGRHRGQRLPRPRRRRVRLRARNLYDEHGEALDSCDTGSGSSVAVRVFSGVVATVAGARRESAGEGGRRRARAGRVLVVDGGGSCHSALLGDNMARQARDNGWGRPDRARRRPGRRGARRHRHRAQGRRDEPATQPQDRHRRRDVPVGFGGCHFPAGRRRGQRRGRHRRDPPVKRRTTGLVASSAMAHLSVPSLHPAALRRRRSSQTVNPLMAARPWTEAERAGVACRPGGLARPVPQGAAGNSSPPPLRGSRADRLLLIWRPTGQGAADHHHRQDHCRGERGRGLSSVEHAGGAGRGVGPDPGSTCDAQARVSSSSGSPWAPCWSTLRPTSPRGDGSCDGGARLLVRRASLRHAHDHGAVAGRGLRSGVKNVAWTDQGEGTDWESARHAAVEALHARVLAEGRQEFRVQVAENEAVTAAEAGERTPAAAHPARRSGRRRGPGAGARYGVETRASARRRRVAVGGAERDRPRPLEGPASGAEVVLLAALMIGQVRGLQRAAYINRGANCRRTAEIPAPPAPTDVAVVEVRGLCGRPRLPSKLATRVRFPSPAPRSEQHERSLTHDRQQTRDTEHDTSARGASWHGRLQPRPAGRQKGSIDVLPSGASRVRAYAGQDPITNLGHNLCRDRARRPGRGKQAYAVRHRMMRDIGEGRSRARPDVGRSSRQLRAGRSVGRCTDGRQRGGHRRPPQGDRFGPERVVGGRLRGRGPPAPSCDGRSSAAGALPAVVAVAVWARAEPRP